MALNQKRKGGGDGNVEFQPKRRQNPDDIARRWMECNVDPDGFSVQFINDMKGYGVFAKKAFQKNEFLLEYVGECVDSHTAEKREKIYKEDNKSKYPRCFMFYFRHNEKIWCIDATHASKSRMGRMVNDSDIPSEKNSKMRKIIVKGTMHLALFATKEINIGDEILYDYGDENSWWRKKTTRNSNEIEDNPKSMTNATRSKVQQTLENNDKSSQIEKKVLPEKSKLDLKNNVENVKSPENMDITLHNDNVSKIKEDNPKSMTKATRSKVQQSLENIDKSSQIEKKVLPEKSKLDLKNNVENVKSPENMDITLHNDNVSKIKEDNPKSMTKATRSKVQQSLENIDKSSQIEKKVLPEKSKLDLKNNVENVKSPENMDITLHNDNVSKIKEDNPKSMTNATRSKVQQSLQNINKSSQIEKKVLPEKSKLDLKNNVENVKSPENMDITLHNDNVSKIKEDNPKSMTNATRSKVQQSLENIDKSSQIEKKVLPEKSKLDLKNNVENVKNPENMDITLHNDNVSKIKEDNPKSMTNATRSKVQQSLENIDKSSQIEKKVIPEKSKLDLKNNVENVKCPENMDITLHNDNVSKIKDHLCLYCGLVYRRKTNLDRHLETCHKNVNDNDDGLCSEDFDDDRDKDYVPDDDYQSEVESSETSDICINELLEESQDFVPDSDDSVESDIYPVLKPNLVTTNNTLVSENNIETKSDGVNIVKAHPVIDNTKHANLDEEKIIVSVANNDDRRHWDRKEACLYCDERPTNLRRHLFRRHSNETEVAKIMSYPKKSSARKIGLDKIRKTGNFYHNAKVRELGEGDFLVVKRPSSKKQENYSFKHFAPCVFCKGYYLETDIWQHYKKCSLKDNVTFDANECDTITTIGSLRASRILAESMSPSNDVATKKGELFATMKSDDITRACKDDAIISAFGLRMFASKGAQQITYIRCKMREMARLLLKVREEINDSNINLKDVLKPDKFENIINAIYTECKYSQRNQNGNFEIPSLALKIGQSLRKCCYIKLSQCIKEEDENGEKETEKLIKLLLMEYSDRVSSIALQTLNSSRRQKPKSLPLTNDVVKFQKFIQEKVISLSQELTTCKDENFASVFASLTKAALARVITFNKRRSGEVALMTLSDFINRNSGGTEISDITKMLCPSEQQLASRLELMKVRGKRDRTVPVILTKDQVDALTLLSDESNRKKADVQEENRFVFPRGRMSLNNVRGYEAVEVMVKEADLTEPNTFKSTGLRKYVATVSQVLDMNENELDWLASHLGHDIRVHRDFYRLQSEQVELAKISKLIFAVDSGKAHKFHGKKLDSIQIEDLDDIVLEDLDKDNEDDSETTDLYDENDQDSRCGMDDAFENFNEMENTETNEGETTEAEKIINPTASEAEKTKKTAATETGKSTSTKTTMKIKKSGKQCVHTSWQKEEKKFIIDYFKVDIINGQMKGVGKKKCDEAIQKGGKILKNRTWVQVKSCLKNIIARNKKEQLRKQIVSFK